MIDTKTAVCCHHLLLDVVRLEAVPNLQQLLLVGFPAGVRGAHEDGEEAPVLWEAKRTRSDQREIRRRTGWLSGGCAPWTW